MVASQRNEVMPPHHFGGGKADESAEVGDARLLVRTDYWTMI